MFDLPTRAEYERFGNPMKLPTITNKKACNYGKPFSVISKDGLCAALKS
jgi:hypothetical protein